MQLHITLYGAMRVVAGLSNVDLSFDTPSVTLSQVIEALTAAYPRVRPYLLDTSGGLHTSLRVLLNNERPDPDMTLATTLHAAVSENVRVPGSLFMKPERRNHALMPQASRLLFWSQDHGLLDSGNARPCLFQRPVAGAVAQPVTELDCAGECLPAG